MIKLFITSLIFIAFFSFAENSNTVTFSKNEISSKQSGISDDEWGKAFYADIEKRFGKDAVTKMKKRIKRRKIYDAVIYSIILIFFICGLIGVGLNKKMNKIHSKLCIIVFILAAIFSIYTVGYSGEQGAVALIFVVPGIGLSCFGITVVLWILQFFNRNKINNS